MAFNQRTGTAGRVADNVAAHEEAKHGTNAAGQPNSLLGKAADRAENRGTAGAGTGFGTGAGHLGTGTGTRGVGTGVGTGAGHLGVGARDSQYGTGAGLRDEQLTGAQRQHGVTGVEGIRTETTGQSEAFCPNPNTPGLAKEFETRVQVIEKVPEMKTVTKTDYVKRLDERTETVLVPKTKVVMEEKERVDMVPHVREVPKTRTEIRHRVVEEEVQVPYTVKEVVNVPVTRKETVPRVVTEQVEQTVTVPVVKEVPVTRKVEVPTGNYCETPINDYTHAGKGLPTGLHGEKLGSNTGILNKEVGASRSTALARGGSSSSSGYGSSDDESKTHRKAGHGLTGTHTTGTGLTGSHATGTGVTGTHTTGTGLTGHSTGLGAPGTTTTAAHPKKKSLLQKIEDKIMPGHSSH
jgi:hypothetical protein